MYCDGCNIYKFFYIGWYGNFAVMNRLDVIAIKAVMATITAIIALAVMVLIV